MNTNNIKKEKNKEKPNALEVWALIFVTENRSLIEKRLKSIDFEDMEEELRGVFKAGLIEMLKIAQRSVGSLGKG